MLKFIKLYIVILIILGSCDRSNKPQTDSSKDLTIQLEGKIESGNGTLVTLDRMEPAAFVPIDSIRCDEKGRFQLEFHSTGINYYALKYTDEGYATLIASPGDKISIEGRADTLYPYTVHGSVASGQVRDLAIKHQEVLLELRELSLRSAVIMGDENYAEKKMNLNQQFDSITGAFHRFSIDFIYSHPESPAVLIALYNQYGPDLPVFHPIDDFEVYRFCDSVLFKHYPENAAVQALHTQLSAALQQIKNANAATKLQIGMKAPDFVLPDRYDKMTALKEFRGKYVLLQIWASWSKPSLSEYPYLDKCLQLYKNKELQLIQVALDDQKSDWLNACTEQNPSIIQLSDLKRWESAIVQLYQIDRIPANFLINPEGIIVEKDIFAEDICPALDNYLSRK